MYTVLISLGGIPGFLRRLAGREMGRKPTCIAALLGGALAVYAYGQTAILAGSETPLIVSGLIMQFFLFGMWAVLYAYTPELYSTGARATGSGSRRPWGGWGRCWARTWWAWCCRTGAGRRVHGRGGLFLRRRAAGLCAGRETRGISLEELSARQPEPSARAVSVPRTR